MAATVSMSKVAVSFTHIIKSAEPAFSVIIQKLFLGENFPLPVYLSLLPIIGGCGLAAATELNFNTTGIPLIRNCEVLHDLLLSCDGTACTIIRHRGLWYLKNLCSCVWQDLLGP